MGDGENGGEDRQRDRKWVLLDNVIDPDTATMIYMMFETCTAHY